jgi:hypothetical protein
MLVGSPHNDMPLTSILIESEQPHVGLGWSDANEMLLLHGGMQNAQTMGT